MELGMDQDRVRSDIPGERLPYDAAYDELLPQRDIQKYQTLVARLPT